MKNKHAQALGKLGGLAGKGKAKARKVTSEQARVAVMARWGQSQSSQESRIAMNILATDKRAMILNCLVEGNSMRSTTRLTGSAKKTVERMLVSAGEACAGLDDFRKSIMARKQPALS